MHWKTKLYKAQFLLFRILVLTGFVSSFLLLLERTWLPDIPKWVFFITTFLTLAVGLFQAFPGKFVRAQFSDSLLWIVISDFMETYASEANRAKWVLRCNVMKLRGDVLYQVASWPSQEPHSTITWKTTQGCCGMAVRDKTPIMQDLSTYRGKQYKDMIDPRDGLPLWDLTQEQWNHTAHLASVVSIPLFAPNNQTKVVGVVNFDAEVPITVWAGSLDAKKLRAQLRAVRRILAMIVHEIH